MLKGNLKVINKTGENIQYSFKHITEDLLYHEGRAIDDSSGDNHTAMDEGGQFTEFEKDVRLNNFKGNLSLNELIRIRKSHLK